MKTKEAIEHFGGVALLADALAISPAAVSQWGDVPPESKQILIERLTKRKLRAEDGAMDRLIGLDKITARAAA